jgi:hypothetical protein
MTDSTSWTISVKTVSSYSSEVHAESNFTITVDPNDSISSIYEKIESHTGLKADQQRLIYRGRLIPAPSQLDSSIQPKDHISDISGLGDGHTIHLVPRPSNTNATEANASAQPFDSESDMPSLSDGGGGRSGFFAPSGPGFLAALLGMNPSDNDIQVETINSDGTTFERRSSSSSTRRRNRNSHIRTENDPLHPEPCQMEVIRQSLLTMHTMMDAQKDLRSKNASHPLQAKRQWYKGQWIDVKDTVNQWLEATVVDILTPDDLIPCNDARFDYLEHPPPNRVIKYDDDAVGSNDEDGRLKLLLEPSDDPNDRTLADLNDNEDLVGYQEREGNVHVRLLLVHFNGWPHRWDEWIRSDSDRIRPFRTRSRHVKKANQFCPEPESDFQDENFTHIRSVDDDIERPALLPEIFRTMTDVQTLYAEAIREDQSSRNDGNKLNRAQLYDLSLAMKCDDINSDDVEIEERNLVKDIVTSAGMTFDSPKDVDLEALDDESQRKLYNLLCQTYFDWEDDENKYPWTGTIRVTDIDKLCDHDQQIHKDQANLYRKALNKKKLQDLAPLLDRLGRILIDAAPHVASIAASLPEQQDERNIEEDAKFSPQMASVDSEGLANVPSDDHENETLAPNNSSQMADHNNGDDASILPDHVDFLNGFINHRENGSNFRRRIHSSDRGSSLLSAYLSNIVGNGGTATPGGRAGNVDVHIHAIVTGPGGVPINPMGGLFSNRNTTADANTTAPINIPQTVRPTTEMNDDLFSGLYETNVDSTNDVEIEDDYPDARNEDDPSMDSLEMPELEARVADSSSSESEMDDDDISNDSDEDMPPLCERTPMDLPQTIHSTTEMNDDLFSGLYETNAESSDDDPSMDSSGMPNLEVRCPGSSSSESEMDDGDISDEDMHSLCGGGADGSGDETQNKLTCNNLDRAQGHSVSEQDNHTIVGSAPVSHIDNQRADSTTRLYSDASEPTIGASTSAENNHSDSIDDAVQPSVVLQDQTPSNTRANNEDESSPTRGWFHSMLRRM